MVKRLATMQETWVQSLGQEDPLEKEMATHSSILAWKIPWTEEPGRLQSMGSQRVGHDWETFFLFFSYCLFRHNAIAHLIEQMHVLSCSNPQFTIGLVLGVVHSVGLNKCKMTCIHHYSVMQSVFTALKTFCACSVHPFCCVWQPRFTVFMVLHFQSIRYLESYNM